MKDLSLKSVWIALLILLAINCIGQNKSTWSNDTAAIGRLLKSAQNEKNIDSAIHLYRDAFELSSRVHYATGAATALRKISLKFIDKGDYAPAADYLKQAYPYTLQSTEKDAIALYYNNTGMLYFYEGKYVQASENYYQALNEIEKTYASVKMSSTAALIYSNLSAVCFRLNQNKDAITYLKIAEEISRDVNDTEELSVLLNNIACYYLNTNNPDSAKVYLFKSLDISKKMGYVNEIIFASSNLGNVYIGSGQYSEACRYLNEVISLAHGKDMGLVINSSYSLGLALYILAKYKQAELVLVKAIQEAESYNLVDNKIRGYETLAKVYQAMKKYDKAIEVMNKTILLKDSLINSEKAVAVNELQLKFKTAEKDKQLALNNVLIAQQKAKIAKKNTWIISTIVLLTAISMIIYFGGKQRQKLQSEKIKTLEQENRINTLKAIVQGEEKERSRIARDLHDGIGGMISATMMRLMTIKHADESIGHIPAYKEVAYLLEEIGEEIRKTSHNLMPEVLLKQNLTDALQSYCSYIQGKNFEVDFQYFGSFEDLEQDIKLGVYRIVQELLKNIVQHSQAKHVFVQVSRHNNILAVTVEDNGIGFDEDKVNKGMGLSNLLTRIKSMDGRYSLESAPDKGTSVYIEFDVSEINIDA